MPSLTPRVVFLKRRHLGLTTGLARLSVRKEHPAGRHLPGKGARTHDGKLRASTTSFPAHAQRRWEKSSFDSVLKQRRKGRGTGEDKQRRRLELVGDCALKACANQMTWYKIHAPAMGKSRSETRLAGVREFLRGTKRAQKDKSGKKIFPSAFKACRADVQNPTPVRVEQVLKRPIHPFWEDLYEYRPNRRPPDSPNRTPCPVHIV